MDEKILKQALIKKALGGEASEVVEEFSADKDGKPVLVKRKVTTKFNLPDVTALKMLMEEEKSSLDISHMTDAELEAERTRLLKMLKEEEDENRKNQSTGQV